MMTLAEQYRELVLESRNYTQEELQKSGVQQALNKLDAQINKLSGNNPDLDDEELDIYEPEAVRI